MTDTIDNMKPEMNNQELIEFISTSVIGMTDPAFVKHDDENIVVCYSIFPITTLVTMSAEDHNITEIMVNLSVSEDIHECLSTNDEIIINAHGKSFNIDSKIHKDVYDGIVQDFNNIALQLKEML